MDGDPHGHKPGLDRQRRAILDALRTKRGNSAPRSKIPRRTSKGVAPLSFAQERLWLVEQNLATNGGARPYNETAAYTFQGPLDVEVLRRSLEAVAERHQILRMAFFEQDGAPVQRLCAVNPFSSPILFEDLRTMSSAVQRAHLEAIAVAQSSQPLLEARQPPLRVRLARLSDTTHVLLLSTHHVITDGWSDSIFLRELAELYRGFVSGRPAQLPDLPIQYTDFALWQRERLADEHLRSALAYWTHQLRDAPRGIALPTEKTATLATFRGAREHVTLDPAVADALRELARQERATMFMVLLAAFDALLLRYSSQDDLAVGVVIANREHLDTQPLIGFFSNMVVLRANLGGNPTFREVIGRVREVVIAAQAHQEVPFDRIVAELGASRADGRNPLFQVAFVFEEATPRVDIGPKLGVELKFLHGGSSAFDLTLMVTATAGGLRCALEYRTDLFDASTIRRLVDHFQTLVTDAIARPDQRVAFLALLSPPERQQLLVGWNDTARAYPRDVCVHQLFEAQVDRTPDAVAAEFDGRRLTYRELDRRANQLARHLSKLGVGPEVLVGICVERSLDMVVGLLGILKAGGGYVPLDPSYPQARLAFMVEDAAISVLVTQTPLVGTLPPHRAQVVCLDVEGAAWDTSRPSQAGSAENVAYVIYTSGSTGTPKGICVTHRSITRLVVNTNYIALGPADCVMQASNSSFDAATFEIWGALLNGASLVGISKQDAVNPRVLAMKIREHGITTMFLTTALFNQIAKHEPTAFAPLKQLLFGGEAVDPHAVREVLIQGPPERLLHVYGPTETTTFASWHEITEVPEGARTISIGLPLANDTLYVLDRDQQVIPIGAAGELYIGGAGLARGYLERPALTAEKFVVNPFGEGRLYRTGDLVRRLANGTIEFIGRIDGQVKIRGFRIELGEIEATLASHPSVQEAVVVAHAHSAEDTRLIAYVVGAAPAVTVLRAYLQAKLPPYMVPSAFVVLDAFPLTPNGKLDRKALPLPGPGLSVGAEFRSRLPFEELLAGLWSTVLGVEIGASEDFFEAGGHSLLLLRLQRLIHERLLVHVPLSELFAAPRLSTMSAAVARHKNQKTWKLAPVTRGDGPDYPASHSQERIWLANETGNRNLVGEMFALEGPLVIDALQGALAAIVDCHSSMRTTFHLTDAGLVQRAQPAGSLPFELVDLTSEPEAEREELARVVAYELAAESPDLAAGPLFRILLIRVARELHYLFLKFDHIIIDGWSFDVLYRDLERGYAALLEGSAPTLARPAFEPGDAAAWERRTHTGANLHDQVAFWRRELADAPRSLTLDLATPRPPAPSYRGQLLYFEWPASLHSKLLELCRQEGVTRFMAGMAAFALTLRYFGGGDDLVIGTPVAMREQSEVRPLVGCFLNEIPIRVRLDGVTTYRDALRRVRDAALRAYDHADVPLDLIVRGLGSREAAPRGAAPVFQVMFELGAIEAPPQLKNLRVSRRPLQFGVALFDITVGVEEHGDVLRGWLEYSHDVFTEQAARTLVAELERAMIEILTAPDSHPVGPPMPLPGDLA